MEKDTPLPILDVPEEACLIVSIRECTSTFCNLGDFVAATEHKCLQKLSTMAGCIELTNPETAFP